MNQWTASNTPDGWIGALKKTSKKEVPDFEIPVPLTRKLKGGTTYYYALPAEWGLDERIVPNAALADKVAVLALSQEHSERLLTPTPFKALGKPLADPKRPLAGASQFHFAGLIDLIASWSDVAAAVAPPMEGSEEALKQAKPLFEILKAFRGSCTARYFEDGALVTHSEYLFVDLK